MSSGTAARLQYAPAMSPITTTTTTNEPDPVPDPDPVAVARERQEPASAAPPPSRQGAVRRLVEWVWGGAAMAALRARQTRPSALTLQLRRRARASLDLGRQALNAAPQSGEARGHAEDLACQLFAQSVHWTLLAARSWRRD